MPVTDDQIAQLKAKLDTLIADKATADAATATRVAAGTAADQADAAFHQAQLDEANADATANADLTDLKAFIDSLS